MEKSEPNSGPAYVLGFRIKGLLKVLAWFIISLVAFIILLKLIAIYPEPHVHQSATNNFFDSGFNFTLNIAGLVSALFLVADFSLVFSTLFVLLTGLVFLSIGHLDLYEDYAIWRRERSQTQVSYDQFEDVYLGYVSSTTGPPSPSGYYGPNNTPVFREIASFYIGKRKFVFNINKKPAIAKFLEQKIPKKNIDVDDFAQDGSGEGSASSGQ